jgi:hypothetical protein
LRIPAIMKRARKQAAPSQTAPEEAAMRRYSFPPVALASALAVLVLHLVTAGHYGIFRDELYYLACADHLDWGYVDQPPLSIAILWAWRAAFGDGAIALRIPPALGGALLVLLTAWIARELGGSRFAQSLAALAVAITPEYLGLASFYSMNAFDLVFWAILFLILIRLVVTEDARLWLAFGAVAGLGLQNKISLLFLGAGVAVAIALTPLRRQLATRWPWLGGVLAALIFAPHVLWQAAHGWPTREFMENAQRYKIAALSPLQFVSAQLLDMHPLNALLWLAGLMWLLFGREGRRFRAVGLVFVSVLAILIIQKSKPYYLAAAFPPLFAAGAIAIDARLGAARWPRLALFALLPVAGLVVAPLAIPLLPVESFIAYQRALGMAPGASGENHRVGPLPQHFADRFGWQEMTAAVARVYASLTPEERRDVIIVTGNYGEAGALNYYGRRLGLPPAVSQHNSFFLWGPGSGTGRLVIAVGMSVEDLAAGFESVTEAARLTSPYAMPYETADPILVCRGLKRPLADAWRSGKHFI